MRVAYFTAGTVGAGHHVRGVAVGRGLARASFACEYKTFGPALPYPGKHLGAHCEVTLDRAELSDPRRAEESPIGRALRAFDPDVVVIDMFWAPLRFVLPRLRGEAWLLLRKCPAVWFAGPDARVRFDASQFARIFAIEPGLAGTPAREEVAPIVVANRDECRPPEALRRHFGLGEGGRLDVVMHAGRPGERARLHEPAAAEGARVLDLFEAGALFPAAEWLGGADRIACGAGYNSFWEARWLGYSERTTFTAFDRPIDDQAWRLRELEGHIVPENGADALARALRG